MMRKIVSNIAKLANEGVVDAWARCQRGLVIVAGALAVIVALYLGLSAFIVSEMLTPPSMCTIRVPSDSGFAAEEIHFQSDVDRVPLAGWLLPSTGDRAILLVHGQASYSWTGTQEDIARVYVEAGFHVLVFDGRGRGRSGGDRLGLGWHERHDVRGAMNVLLKRGFEPGRIGVHGTSYGATTALLSAAVISEVGAVVADSAFADVRDFMDIEIERKTKIPALFSRLVLRPGIAFVAQAFYDLDLDAIPPERAVPHIAPRPILFIHGSEDRRIPVEHARRLKAASKNPADELWIHPLGHTDGVRIGRIPPKCLGEPSPMREAYLRRVTEFFDRSLQ